MNNTPQIFPSMLGRGGYSYKIAKPIRLIELFAGIGAQAKALEKLGVNFEHYKICEIDKYACKAYNLIHNTNFETSDISSLHASDLEIADTDKYEYILTYSFPCTSLSTLGKQQGMVKGSNTASSLLWEVQRILAECEHKNLPQILLMENIPQIHSKKNIKQFEEWQAFLVSLGYTNYWQDLSAKDYGVPQSRNRCFMVSILNSPLKYEFPLPFALDKNLQNLLEDKVDRKYFLSKLMVECCMSQRNKTFNRQKIFLDALKQPNLKGVAKTLTTANDKSTSNYIIEEAAITDKQDNIYNLEGSSFAALISAFPNFSGNIRIRKLTPKECFRLMGFEDKDFEILVENKISNTQLYKMAGNSIVVDVLYYIFKQFFNN